MEINYTMKLKGSFVLFFAIMAMSLLVACETGSSGDNKPVSSSSKDITSFSFLKNTNSTVLDHDITGSIVDTNISVTVPVTISSVSSLVADFTTTGDSVSIGGEEQESGFTLNDFSSSKTYIVTAEDNSKKTYTVTVKKAVSLEAGWARALVAGNDSSLLREIVTSPDGSVYAVGNFYGKGTFDFGNDVSVTGLIDSATHALIVKYNREGVAEWARTITAGSSTSDFKSIAISSDGMSIYAAGTISGTGNYNFGSGVIAGSAKTNAVLVKYDRYGTAKWARTSTNGLSGTAFSDIAVSSDSSIYAVGSLDYPNTYDFGNGVTVGGPNYYNHVVIVKYNSSGLAQWAKTVTTNGGNSYFYDVAVSSDGSAIYAMGSIGGSEPESSYNNTYTFSAGVTAKAAFRGANTSNCMFVKYNNSGTAQWVQTVTSANANSSFRAIRVAPDGSVYLACSIDQGSFTFSDSVSLQGENGWNAAVLKYNSAGTVQWARTVVGGGSNSGFSDIFVSADSASVYIAGKIYGTGTFNYGKGITATGSVSDKETAVILEYSNSGDPRWARYTTGGVYGSNCYGVCSASDGTLYTAGIIYGTEPYGFGNNVTASGTCAQKSNLVIARYE